MTNRTRTTTSRRRRALIGAASSAALAATLIVAAPMAASATETYRYGPYYEARDCITDRDYAQSHRPSNWTFGGCYQLGPGAAAWYYNGYYSG